MENEHNKGYNQIVLFQVLGAKNFFRTKFSSFVGYCRKNIKNRFSNECCKTESQESNRNSSKVQNKQKKWTLLSNITVFQYALYKFQENKAEKGSTDDNFQKANKDNNFHYLPLAINYPLICNQEKAILLGGQGVGKSTIFQKFSGIKSSVGEQFLESYQFEFGFTILDSPAFEIYDSSSEKLNVLSKFSDFLNEYQNSISTIFLLIKYQRTDLMKKNYYQIMNYLWQFKSQIVILITFWDLKETKQDENIQQNLIDFFKNSGINVIQFIQKEDSSEHIQKTLKKSLTGLRGLRLEGTIFEIEPNEKIINGKKINRPENSPEEEALSEKKFPRIPICVTQQNQKEKKNIEMFQHQVLMMKEEGYRLPNQKTYDF